MTKQARLACTKCIVDTTNQRVLIITKPSQYNKSGAFGFPNAVFENLANQLGMVGAELIQNINGAILTFDSTPVKAGETWLNKKTGEEGLYTVDHNRNTNYKIELSKQTLFMLSAARAAGQSFDFNAFFGNIAPNEPIAEEEHEDGRDIADPIVADPVIEDQQA